MLPINSSAFLTSSVNSAEVTPASTGKSKPVDSPDQQKLKKSAGDFESILLASMWKSMKESFKDPKESDSDPASGTVDDWGIEAMSSAVGKVGGIGIGNMIIKQLGHEADAQSAGNQDSGANVLGKLADIKR